MNNYQEKLNSFLAAHRKGSRIVTSITSVDIQKFPGAWESILGNQNDTTNAILNVWKEELANELSLTINTLRTQIKSVYVVVNGESAYSLMYAVDCEGDIYFYEGLAPNDSPSNNSLKDCWYMIDEKLKWFYGRIHNGWYLASTKSLGLLPIESVFALGEKDWGILDDIEVTIDLDKTFAFFHNGAGGYLCLNFEDSIPSGLLWWKDEEPTLDIDFWDYLDEWIKIGIQN